MQIHPELGAILAGFKDLPPIDIQSTPINEVRRVLDHIGMPQADLPMHEVLELQIPNSSAPGVREPSHYVPARLYRPTASRNAPLLVFFHGGGWCMGTLDTHDNLCRHIAQIAGMNVCSVAYRLAPEHPFPAPLDDAYAATRWCAEHARALLHSDPERLYVGGDSAGGNLAIATCLKARDDGWAQHISGQLLLYPVCDAGARFPSYESFGDLSILSRSSMAKMWEFYHPERPVHRLASVLDCASFSGMPPAVVVTAELDILRDEGRQLARRMHEDGVPVMLHQAAGMTHGFASFSTVVLDVAEILRAACSRLCIPNTLAKV